MTTKAFFLCLSLILLISDLFANPINKPQAYLDMPSENISRINLTKTSKSNASFAIFVANKNVSFTLTNEYVHANGDVSFQAMANDKKSSIQATLGNNSIFGQMHYAGSHYLISTDKSGSYLIQLPNSGLSYNACGFEHKKEAVNGSVKAKQALLKPLPAGADPSTVIDFLFLYTQEMLDRYPGDLLQTRLNQYFAVANQSFANTQINLSLRLVASELTNYNSYNSNFAARNDIHESLSGATIEGLETLKQSREQYGADMVVLIRPHNIETRGSCGIAFFPRPNQEQTEYDPSYGVHVMSDGMSSWSLCTDQLLVHELGHNLGAGHHNASIENQFIPGAAGFAKIGQFTTIMGSFGTGQPERFLEIDVFSNPSIQCGGGDCGTLEGFNNAKVINQVKDVVASYQPSVSSLPIPSFQASNPDSDNDGSNDWEDHFPFDASQKNDSDNDGVSDSRDVFPNDATEQFDTDNDGTGDNEDMDDDGDGVNDVDDFYPLDSNESADSDRDGVADNADAFPNDYKEQLDYDSDGIGDNEDTDDDNDNYTDSGQMQDILIISVGNNRIVRFDAQTGASGGIEVLSDDGLLTFQSDLAYRVDEQALYYTSSSSVKKVQLSNRLNQGIVLPAYPRNSFEETNVIALYSGFPTALTDSGIGELYVNRLNALTTLVYRGSNPYFSYQSWDFSYYFGDFFSAPDDFTIIDSTYANDSMYFLDQANIIHRGSNVGLLEILHQGGMNDPFALAVSASLSTIYVSNQGSNSIATIDSETGNLKDLVIDLNELGYSNPTGLVVTDTDTLLVAASDQNAILKFNAVSGEFLGVLISENGLDQPHKMILVPKLNDRFSNDEQKVIKPNAGLWYNPATNGRGFDIQVFNNRLSVIWYTYDEQGLPMWYISSGDLSGFDFSGDFLKTRQAPDGTVSTKNVGSLSITFNNEREAEINWTLNASSGQENIQWLAWSSQEEIENYTGLWGREDGPGWGVTVATIGETSVAVPYVYDSSGEPRWAFSEPVHTTSPLVFTLNTVFSDTLCPSCSGEPITTQKPSGSMTLDFANKTWQSQLQFPLPLGGNWLLENTDIVRFSSEPTRPR